MARGHGHTIAKGGDAKKMMAELLGRATDYSGGKGGSMHIADMDKHMLGANGIVGGGMGLATGAALTARLQKTGSVVICFFGDGALEQGILHETTNLAAIWKLPVVFVCENNQYAMSARSDWSIAGGDPAKRAAGYGIPGVTVDGMDLFAVNAMASELVERWRLRDPIEQVKKAAVDGGVMSLADFEELERRIEALIDEAVEFAKTSP